MFSALRQSVLAKPQWMGYEPAALQSVNAEYHRATSAPSWRDTALATLASIETGFSLELKPFVCAALTTSVLANPPWMDHEVRALSIIASEDVAPFNLSLGDAVQAKLASIDTSQSVELRRFVALTSHEVAHYQMQWLDLGDFVRQPLLYDAYGFPSVFRQASHNVGCVGDWITEEWIDVIQAEGRHRLYLHIRKLLFLNLVFDLIDRVVDYWNEVALARIAWRVFSGAFRRFLETVLRFKPFHTPLRLFPSSIHPIDSAA